MSKESTQTITCQGGLDESSNSFQLFNTPGAATRLQNYEVSIEGGYRRINGYTQFGTATPSGGSTPILGLFRYNEGVLACQGDDIYFSTDGITWSSKLTRSTTQLKNTIALYEGDNELGQVIFTDGANKVAVIEYTTGGGWSAIQLDPATTGAPQGSKYACIYKERLAVASGSTVYWSNRFDVTDFTGASAGAVDVGDVITGLKVHRDNLFVFCRNSIHYIAGIDEAPQRKPVTRNIGCVNGYSIQEVGGDLIFLAKDGLRTIAGTDRIDDVELSTVSRKLNKTLTSITRNITAYNINSCVIRDKNQYRLFYSQVGSEIAEQLGIIGVLTYGEQGTGWEWSTTIGIEVTSISSEVDTDTIERIYHGDYDGVVYQHDTGTSFNGSAIEAIYKSPDINFGDANLRKTMYTVKTSIAPEESSDITLRIRYDFSNASIMHPDDYTLSTVTAGAVYGAGIYGTAVYGANIQPLEKINVEGSGVSASFQYKSDDTTSSYTISGFYVDLQVSGRID